MTADGKTELLQIQRDRFIHNWRKIGKDDTYPRFERMLETFMGGYQKFKNVTEKEQIGSISPNQCEVSYINQIALSSDQTPFDAFEKLFGSFATALFLDDLGKPEEARFLLCYVIFNKNMSPIGRLILNALPARKLDGTNIIQLTLVARGKPETPDLDGVAEFLKSGRRYIVRAFTELTSAEMHKAWERQQ